MVKYTLFFFLLSASTIACGSDPVSTCVDLCEAAQAQNCTSVNHCSADCTLLSALAGKADCQGQRDAYLNCAESVAVCTIDASCRSEENAFGACVVPYCLANPTDPDCP